MATPLTPPKPIRKRGRPPNTEPAARGKRKYTPKMCAKHGQRENRCSLCSVAPSICAHGVAKYRCTQCVGASICEHGKVRNVCVTCLGCCLCPLCYKARTRCKCKVLSRTTLPQAFSNLEIIFGQVIRILATAHARGGKRGTPLGNLKDDMSKLHKRTLRKEHLKQILALVPDCLIVSHAWKDGKFCHRTVSINPSWMNLRPGEQIIHGKSLEDMKSSFRQSSLSFLRARHVESLQTHPPLRFDVAAVALPSIDLPSLPQAQASAASSNVVEDEAVKITPEIQKAFEKHQTETMTPAKLKHIRDCSKSAIGLQNLEKLRSFELTEFALQEKFKVADEKNAESKFRTAADALRSLFRQRDKRALPVADVLKVLQQSRGLTFKSNLDAMETLNDVVDKLPTFFSKKTFPTNGEMIMFSSSELLPWHQPRVYPQTKQ